MAGSINLPPLVQRIVLDPTGVGAAATKVSRAINPVSKAATTTAKSVGAMSTSLNTLSFRAQTTGRLLFRNIGMPLALVGAVAVKSFVDFEKSLTKIQALVGISSGAVANFSDKIKEVAEISGRGPQELADAMFFVTSAGLRGSVAMEVLEASAKGAAIGLGDTSIVVDAATSAVNAYGSENLSGAQAVDVLTAAVREGKVEATRLTPAIGKAIPVASAMGIEFHEVAAAIAAMTRTGTDARTSAIQLRQIMQSILDPSRQTTRALTQMGVAEGELADIARKKGLLTVLVKLRELSKDNAEAFADVFPNVRALAGALDITGENLDENTQIFEALANATGDTDDAMQKTAESGAHILRVAMTKLKLGFLEFGASLKPLINTMAKFLTSVGAVFKALAASGVIMGAIGGISVLSITAGLALMTFGKLAQASIFLTASLQRLGVAATVAAARVRMLTIASGVGVFAMMAVVIGGIVGSLIGFGKQSKSTEKTLGNLVEELDDVRTAGEFTIKKIGGLTDALKKLKRETQEAKLADAFNAAFGDGIKQAFDDSEGTIGGGLQGEAAIATFFFGKGDTPAVRKALDAVIKDLNMHIGTESDAFLRMFGSADNTDRAEAITNFLIGNEEGTKAAISIRAQVAADQLIGTFDGITDDAWDKFGEQLVWGVQDGVYLGTNLADAFKKNLIDEEALKKAIFDGVGSVDEIMGDVLATQEAGFGTAFNFTDENAISNVIASVVGDADDAMDAFKPFADTLDKHLRNNNFVEFSTMWNEFVMDMTASHMEDGFFTPEGVAQLEIVNGLLAHTMQDVSQFGKVFEEAGATDFDSMMRAIVAAMSEEDWKSINAGTETFATNWVIASREVELFSEMFRQYGSPALTDAEKLTMKHEMAIKLTTDAFANQESMVRKVAMTQGEMFDQMTVAWSKADKAAKQVSERYDNLIGRTKDLGEVHDEFNGSLQGMVDTLSENSGSLDMFTEAGRENRDALREQIDTAADYAEAMLTAGSSADEAKDGFAAALGTVTANALANNVDQKELDQFYQSMGLTGERIEMMFMDDDSATIGSALSETMREVAEEQRNTVGPLFSGVGEDVYRGMLKGMDATSQEVLDNLSDLVQDMINQINGPAPHGFAIHSPSKVFYGISSDIIDGFNNGVYDGIPKVRNAFREMVDSAISVTNKRIGTVTGAVQSILDLERARKALKEVKREAGESGIDTDFEKLTKARLQRNVKSAERALRMGEGHIEDLHLALKEAEWALADFDEAAARGDELKRAELGVVEAGMRVVESQADMRMEGEAAMDMFTDMATAVGLSETAIENLLAVSGEQDSFFEKLIAPETLQAINDVANGMGIIEEKSKGTEGDGTLAGQLLATGGAGAGNQFGTAVSRVPSFEGGYGNLQGSFWNSQAGLDAAMTQQAGRTGLYTPTTPGFNMRPEMMTGFQQGPSSGFQSINDNSININEAVIINSDAADAAELEEEVGSLRDNLINSSGIDGLSRERERRSARGNWPRR